MKKPKLSPAQIEATKLVIHEVLANYGLEDEPEPTRETVKAVHDKICEHAGTFVVGGSCENK